MCCWITGMSFTAGMDIRRFLLRLSWTGVCGRLRDTGRIIRKICILRWLMSRILRLNLWIVREAYWYISRNRVRIVTCLCVWGNWEWFTGMRNQDSSTGWCVCAVLRRMTHISLWLRIRLRMRLRVWQGWLTRFIACLDLSIM